LRAGNEGAPVAAITFDVEMDAPPYMSSWVGVDEGLPAILELLEKYKVKATFFTLGLVAEKRPKAVAAIIDKGHELGSHGFSHKRLDRIPLREAAHDIMLSLKTLRDYGDIVSFRAPNLKLPPSLLPLLEMEGIRVDSSVARYKPPFRFKPYREHSVMRIPVSYPSSVLRLPWRVLRALFKPGLDYVVLLHPWEVVGVKCTARPDLTAGVGLGVLSNLGRLIEYLASVGYEFRVMGELVELYSSRIGV